MSVGRPTSSSFAIEKSNIITRHPSFQIDSRHDQQINPRFTSLLEGAIRLFTQENQSYKWQIQLINEKRKLHGLKARLRWKDLNRKHSLLIKLCVPTNFDHIKINKNYDMDDFIIELQGINFHLAIDRQRQFQQFLDSELRTQLEATKNKGVTHEEWLHRLLTNISKRMISEEKQDFKDKAEFILNDEKVNKHQINQNYILCPAPVAMTWSPQGIICISQHRTVPRVRGSYIGTKKFINYAFEGGQTGFKSTVKEDNQLFQDINEVEESEFTQIFSWQFNQSLDFLDKSGTILEDTKPPFIDQSKHNTHHRKLKTIESKRSDILMLVDLNKTSAQLGKFYRQWLTKQAPDGNHTGNHENIRIYRIQGQDKELENDMMFLIHRVNDVKDKSIMETILKNQLSGFKIFDGSSTDIIQYRLICKIVSDKLNHTHRLPLYLKAMMIENEMISQLLGKYFSSMANNLPLTHEQTKVIRMHNTTLGSYLHFEYLRCQKILMTILDGAVFGQHEPKAARGLKMKKQSYLIGFHPQTILSQSEAIDFYKRIIPILELRNRAAQHLEYRKIMRIILANDQLKDFLKNLNNLVDIYTKDRKFLEQIISEYKAEEAKQASSKHSFVRRHFKLECLHGHMSQESYELWTGEARCEECQHNQTMI